MNKQASKHLNQQINKETHKQNCSKYFENEKSDHRD